MTRFRLTYEIEAMNKVKAQDHLEALIFAGEQHQKPEIVPVHKPSKPDVELPADVHCYYVRSSRRGRFACVLFRLTDGQWSRGVSIMSFDEKSGFDRVHAKSEAYDRLMTAETQHHSTPMGTSAESVKTFIAALTQGAKYQPYGLSCKACHGALLTEFEVRLVQGRKDPVELIYLPTVEDILAGSETSMRLPSTWRDEVNAYSQESQEPGAHFYQGTKLDH